MAWKAVTILKETIKVTLGKCWQTTKGALVFQCSTHDGVQRKKGYLIVDPFSPAGPVYFATEKPEDTIASGNIAMLVRKHLAAASLSGIAVHSQTDPKGFTSKEYIRLWLQGKTNSDEPCELWMIASHKPQKEINIIKSQQSIARLHAHAQYTSPKSLESDIIGEEENLPEEGYQAWLKQVLNPSQTIDEPVISGMHQDLPSAHQQVVSELHRTAKDRIARRLKTLKKTLQQDFAKIPSQEQLREAKDDAALLRSYLWLVKPEAIALRLDASQTGSSSRDIALDPNLTAGANLERLFNRIKKLEKALLLGLPRVQKIEQQIAAFESALEKLRQPQYVPTDREVLSVLQQLGLERESNQGSSQQLKASLHKINQNKMAKPVLGRSFRSASGALLVLGRNAQESDLVVKGARSQDWWLHIAGGGHGSHVIITGSSVKSELPAQDLRDGAILALHFSDRSQSAEGEVYVARRHQIKKRKGMAPGLWQIDRAETCMIRYSADELAALFAREIRDGQQRHQPTTP